MDTCYIPHDFIEQWKSDSDQAERKSQLGYLYQYFSYSGRIIFTYGLGTARKFREQGSSVNVLRMAFTMSSTLVTFFIASRRVIALLSL